MTQDLEILQGTIQAAVYQNYDNGYSVLRLNIGQSPAGDGGWDHSPARGGGAAYGNGEVEHPFQLRQAI